MNATEYVNGLCAEVRADLGSLASANTAEKNAAILSIASALRHEKDAILKANAEDIAASDANGVPKTMIDRLTLTESRIDAIAASLVEIAALPDPCGIGTVTTRPNGLRITKMSVPLGVIGMIYEARPNVTVDAAALCLKSGNGVILKGGKEALATNRELVRVMKSALSESAVSPKVIALIDSADRAATTALMNARGLIDVLIPRGGKGLIRAVVEGASVPVIETGAGNCHVYVDESADMDMAVKVAINAKCSRPSVCNAAETILVHAGVAAKFLPAFAKAADVYKVEIRGCGKTKVLVPSSKEATEEDYMTEFNDYIVAVKVVDTFSDAISHIDRYSTGHSEAIITENEEHAQRFCREINSAAVYVNASTRFTDGGEFGFGAEIGISTQKLHVRGPMGLFALTTEKYIVKGNGAVRE